jgi:hypothetical protein
MESILSMITAVLAWLSYKNDGYIMLKDINLARKMYRMAVPIRVVI